MADRTANEGEGIQLYPFFFIPGGSLAEFPSSLEKVFSEEDARHLCENEWFSSRVAPCVLTVYPALLQHTYNMPLEQQQFFARNVLEPLTPYDIACVAALCKKSGLPQPFKGRVRTEVRVHAPLSHLHVSPVTVIASFDEAGVLHFTKGYASQVAADLGFLVGERQLLG